MEKLFENLSVKELKTIRRKAGVSNSVVYYPTFKSSEELSNHYHRACWYLPYKKNVIEEVKLFSDGAASIQERPKYMAPPVSPSEHICDLKDMDIESLVAAKCVLLWDYPSETLIQKFQKLGIKPFNITTNDLNTAEYGNYCKVLWQLTSNEEKDKIIESSHTRFKHYLKRLASKEYKAAAVFGTGPSIDLAPEFDFSQCFTHSCNTVILSEELMGAIKPDFLSAGDVVSHFGISEYAHQYRERLHLTLQSTDCMFLTTSQFGYLFMVQYPDVADKVLVSDQRGFLPNYDLNSDWNLPCLDSVFNIHMAPTASTFSDTIFVLGCDGKNPDESLNEDFWQHSKKAQLHNLVDSGHMCHPTFDVHRQKSTWDGYQNSVQQTCGLGENLYGKRFFTLHPSYTVGLNTRFIDIEELQKNFPFLMKRCNEV